MNRLKLQLIVLHLMLFAGLLLPLPAFSETSQEKPTNTEPTPIVIKSKTMEMNNKLKSGTFTGDVNAKKDDFSTYISNEDIRGDILDIESKNTLLICDSCFSGSLLIIEKDGGDLPEDYELYKSRHAITSGREVDRTDDGEAGSSGLSGD